MLSIEPSQNTQAAITYFRANLSMNDYYSEKEQVIGQWHGNAAQHLNLQGNVHAKDFEALLYNKNPNTDNRLTARNSANRRPMYDFTFSPVKSVSILHAITGDKDIIEAHHKAVQKTMLEVEANMQTQVGTAGKGKGKHYVKTGNIIYAEFLHDTTRPTLQQLKKNKNYVPDPQLHSHCTVINATYFKEQNRWRAIEVYGVKKQAPYYEALYHAHLGQELKNKGYDLYKTDERWEVNGVSREVIDKYSNRTKEIEIKAEKEGISDPKHKAKLGRITRHDKNKSVDEKELPKIWKDRLTLSEYHAIINAKKSNDDGKGEPLKPVDTPVLTPEKKKTPIQTQEPKSNKHSPQVAIILNKSLDHYMERNSGIEKNRVLAYAMNLGGHEYHADEFKRALEQRPDILSTTNKKGIEFITTNWMNEQEGYLVERTADGRATKPALNPLYETKAEYLNKGQKAATQHVLNSHDRIIMVSGDAGTGKTTLLKEIQQGIKEGNKTLHAFAPTSDAAKNVLRKEGFDNADTIAQLLVNKKMQERMYGNVIAIDEAGQVGVPTMNKIITIAEEQKARLLLVGDWKQHSSVEAGSAMKLIETRSGIEIARVNEIVRQRHVERYKNVVTKMAGAIRNRSDEARKERMEAAYDDLNKNGSIIEIKEKSIRHNRIADDYLIYTKKKTDDALVVSPTIKEGKVLTETIREKLRDDGRIGKIDKTFYALQSKQFTKQQKKENHNYSKEDIIEFHQNVSGFKAGLRYLVTGSSQKGIFVKAENEEISKQLNTHYHKDFDVYTKDEIQFARRDLLRITKNTKSLEGQALHNGKIYQIKGFDWRGDIVLENGATLTKNNMHMKHGYVSTSPASQGKDAKTVLVAQSGHSGKAAYDKQFYTSVSRGTEQCKIYTDSKSKLRDSISKNADGMSASEISDNIAKQKENNQQAHFDEQRNYEEETAKMDYIQSVRNFYDDHVKANYENVKSQYYEQQLEKNLGQSEPEPEI